MAFRHICSLAGFKGPTSKGTEKEMEGEKRKRRGR